MTVPHLPAACRLFCMSTETEAAPATLPEEGTAAAEPAIAAEPEPEAPVPADELLVEILGNHSDGGESEEGGEDGEHEGGSENGDGHEEEASNGYGSGEENGEHEGGSENGDGHEEEASNGYGSGEENGEEEHSDGEEHGESEHDDEYPPPSESSEPSEHDGSEHDGEESHHGDQDPCDFCSEGCEESEYPLQVDCPCPAEHEYTHGSVEANATIIKGGEDGCCTEAKELLAEITQDRCQTTPCSEPDGVKVYEAEYKRPFKVIGEVKDCGEKKFYGDALYTNEAERCGTVGATQKFKITGTDYKVVDYKETGTIETTQQVETDKVYFGKTKVFYDKTPILKELDCPEYKFGDLHFAATCEPKIDHESVVIPEPGKCDPVDKYYCHVGPCEDLTVCNVDLDVCPHDEEIALQGCEQLATLPRVCEEQLPCGFKEALECGGWSLEDVFEAKPFHACTEQTVHVDKCLNVTIAEQPYKLTYTTKQPVDWKAYVEKHGHADWTQEGKAWAEGCYEQYNDVKIKGYFIKPALETGTIKTYVFQKPDAPNEPCEKYVPGDCCENEVKPCGEVRFCDYNFDNAKWKEADEHGCKKQCTFNVCEDVHNKHTECTPTGVIEFAPAFCPKYAKCPVLLKIKPQHECIDKCEVLEQFLDGDALHSDDIGVPKDELYDDEYFCVRKCKLIDGTYEQVGPYPAKGGWAEDVVCCDEKNHKAQEFYEKLPCYYELVAKLCELKLYKLETLKELGAKKEAAIACLEKDIEEYKCDIARLYGDLEELKGQIECLRGEVTEKQAELKCLLEESHIELKHDPFDICNATHHDCCAAEIEHVVKLLSTPDAEVASVPQEEIDAAAAIVDKLAVGEAVTFEPSADVEPVAPAADPAVAEFDVDSASLTDSGAEESDSGEEGAAADEAAAIDAAVAGIAVY
eukprot:tig00000157_g9688.t1